MILSNLLAITLTLTGPRFWILIKAFIFSISALLSRMNCRLGHGRALLNHAMPTLLLTHDVHARINPLSNGLFQQIELQGVRPNRFVEERVEIIQRSHSELGAAFSILVSIWRVLQSGKIRLSNLQTSWTTMHRIWRNVMSRPLDLAMSILFSVIFVGIFVLRK